MCWLLNVPSHTLVYLRDVSAQTSARGAISETEAADQTFYLIKSQNTDTGPTSPSADPITPGATGVPNFRHDSEKSPRRKRESNPGSASLEADTLTTRPTGRSVIDMQRSQKNGMTVDETGAHVYTRT